MDDGSGGDHPFTFSFRPGNARDIFSQIFGQFGADFGGFDDDMGGGIHVRQFDMGNGATHVFTTGNGGNLFQQVFSSQQPQSQQQQQQSHGYHPQQQQQQEEEKASVHDLRLTLEQLYRGCTKN
uniref:Uncharacterized protein n=1 Tax=Lygus hesperus TaxID=30085 RepID=A0A0A9XQJ9_LYGHE